MQGTRIQVAMNAGKNFNQEKMFLWPVHNWFPLFEVTPDSTFSLCCDSQKMEIQPFPYILPFCFRHLLPKNMIV